MQHFNPCWYEKGVKVSTKRTLLWMRDVGEPVDVLYMWNNSKRRGAPRKKTRCCFYRGGPPSCSSGTAAMLSHNCGIFFFFFFFFCSFQDIFLRWCSCSTTSTLSLSIMRVLFPTTIIISPKGGPLFFKFIRRYGQLLRDDAIIVKGFCYLFVQCHLSLFTLLKLKVF